MKDKLYGFMCKRPIIAWILWMNAAVIVHFLFSSLILILFASADAQYMSYDALTIHQYISTWTGQIVWLSYVGFVAFMAKRRKERPPKPVPALLAFTACYGVYCIIALVRASIQFFSGTFT